MDLYGIETPKMPTDCRTVSEYLSRLAGKHAGTLSRFYIGRTLKGTPIPALSYGGLAGKEVFLLVGAHHGMEHITSTVLLTFAADFARSVKSGEAVYGERTSEILKKRSVVIIPMLNCDGVDLQIHGLQESDPLRDRLLSINGSRDFSRWQANGRGVDLNHNYNAGFYEYKKIERSLGVDGGAPTKYSGLYPESEPETSSLCGFIRTVNVKGILTLHTQGEVIYPGRGAEEAAKILAGAAGYELSVPEGTALYGGLTDWASEKLGIASFTVECGKGRNPLPSTDFPSLYNRLRKLLFSFVGIPA